MIQTVLGQIDPDQLGFCLPHEHIWCDQRFGPRVDLLGTTRSESTYMRLDDFDVMVAELTAYREAGGRAIVEVTCNGWGRDLDMLARLSEASEVHILSTSGFYIEPHIPQFVHEWPLERIADRITREVQSGVGDSKRRCGPFQVGDTPRQGRGRGVEGAEGRGHCPEAHGRGDYDAHHGKPSYGGARRSGGRTATGDS